MIWLYDGTFDGLLTAFFEAFAHKDTTGISSGNRGDQPMLFDIRDVTTDSIKSDRVMAGIVKLDAGLPDTLYKAMLSQFPDIENAMLSTLKLGFQLKKSPLPLRHISYVRDVLYAAGKVGWQAGKYIGLIRMHRINDDLYAADIEPDYQVLPLIGDHFTARYADTKVLIRDLTHRSALVCENDRWHIAPLPSGDIPPLPKETEITDLWRTFFKTVANPQRKNPKLQQHFVPKKFRKHIVEFNDE